MSDLSGVLKGIEHLKSVGGGFTHWSSGPGNFTFDIDCPRCVAEKVLLAFTEAAWREVLRPFSATQEAGGLLEWMDYVLKESGIQRPEGGKDV